MEGISPQAGAALQVSAGREARGLSCSTQLDSVRATFLRVTNSAQRNGSSWLNRHANHLKRAPFLLGITLAALLTANSVLTAQPANAAPNPLIIITETDGHTYVRPDRPTDSYTIRLATPSTGRTWFTLVPTNLAAPAFAEISIDGGVSWGSGKMVLNIAAGDTSEHTVMVRWADPALTPDDYEPTTRVMTILHPADSFDPDYDTTEGVSVIVGMDPPTPPGPPSPVAPTPPAKIETAAR